MHRFLLLISIMGALALSKQAHAQQPIEELLESGVEAHRMYNLAKAEEILQDVMLRKNELTPLQYGRALYFQTRNLGQIARKEAEGLTGYVDFGVQARFYKIYDQYLELEALRVPRWSEKARPDLENLAPLAAVGGVSCLDAMVDDPDNISMYRTLAEGYITLIRAIDPDHYVPSELQGQIHYLLGEKEKAIAQFEQALKDYRKNRALIVDNMRMPDVYYRVALHYLEVGDLDQAYALASLGLKRNEFEWQTLNKFPKKFPPETVELNRPLWTANQYNLGLLNLELVVLFEDKKDSALLQYTERERYYGDVFSFHYNYAGLLSDVDWKKSAIHYQKAIDLEPNSYKAHYHMSLLYINQGAILINKKEANRELAATNRQKGEELLNTGLDYMKTAHRLSPKDPAPLVRLVQVAGWLKLKEEQKTYKEKLSQL